LVRIGKTQLLEIIGMDPSQILHPLGAWLSLQSGPMDYEIDGPAFVLLAEFQHALPNVGPNAESFLQFSRESLLITFPGFHAAARKLPTQAKYGAGTSLSEQESAVLLYLSGNYPKDRGRLCGTLHGGSSGVGLRTNGLSRTLFRGGSSRR
jgi:hypothetical protein